LAVCALLLDQEWLEIIPEVLFSCSAMAVSGIASQECGLKGIFYVVVVVADTSADVYRMLKKTS
jgi:hypothetical protein